MTYGWWKAKAQKQDLHGKILTSLVTLPPISFSQKGEPPSLEEVWTVHLDLLQWVNDPDFIEDNWLDIEQIIDDVTKGIVFCIPA